MQSTTWFLVLSTFAILFALGARGEEGKGGGEERVFELRTYYAAPGKLDDLHARFRDHTNKLFTKHGMTMIGYWTPVEGTGTPNTLVYILAFPSKEARQKSWDDFKADPEWVAARNASEVNGKLVDKVVSVFLKPTDYSPMK